MVQYLLGSPNPHPGLVRDIVELLYGSIRVDHPSSSLQSTRRAG